MAHRARNEADEAIVVAGIALRTSRNVGYRLGEGINGRETATMAGRTLGCGTRVVHAGWPKTDVVTVAGIALCRGRNVGTRLAKCRNAVVAS